jgi:hypothetical protein
VTYWGGELSVVVCGEQDTMQERIIAIRRFLCIEYQGVKNRARILKRERGTGESAVWSQ